MKLFISICAFILCFLAAQTGFSQKEIEVSGKKYLLHEVKKGETAYSLCLRYKITQNELTEANPGLTAVLKSDTQIRIPVRNEVKAPKAETIASKIVVAEPEYYYHKVFKKQTLFSIARQYGITANDLIKYNPELTHGLGPGSILKIPVKPADNAIASAHPKAMYENPAVTSQNQANDAGYRMHTVTAGETIYRLEQTYGVTREELIRLNPFLASGLKSGTQLRIPQKQSQALSETKQTFVVDNPAPGIAEGSKVDEPDDCNPIAGQNNQKYRVALLLPLYLPGNNHTQPGQLSEESLLNPIDFSQLSNQWFTTSSDSTASATIAIDPKAESFLEFYEGALLALDSLQQQGMDVEFCVFDASNQQMINRLLQMDLFRELDLIIGPVYPELQESVASFAAKNRIPMVSPLASNGTYEENNPYFFKVNPSKEYLIEQSARYMANEFKDKNFVLLTMNGGSNSTEAQVAELGREHLLAAKNSNTSDSILFHEYSFQHQGLQGVKEFLDETGENIFVIPTDNEAQVSVAVTNLNALAEHYNVVLMGTSGFPKLKSIQTENYHRVRLRYLASTFVNYQRPLVRHFIARYRHTFSDEPTQFSFQGYDVTYYFVSALHRYGNNFRNCLPEYPMELTQLYFNIKKVKPMGGYMNHSLFVTSYERNFDVVNLGALVSETR